MDSDSYKSKRVFNIQKSVSALITEFPPLRATLVKRNLIRYKSKKGIRVLTNQEWFLCRGEGWLRTRFSKRAILILFYPQLDPWALTAECHISQCWMPAVQEQVTPVSTAPSFTLQKSCLGKAGWFPLGVGRVTHHPGNPTLGVCTSAKQA